MDAQDAPVVTAASQDSRNIATLTWVGTIFFWFIPALVVYLIKKDDSYVQEQSKEALNWSITAVIGYAISWVLAFILIGFVLMLAVGICHLVFCIMGAIACSKGDSFKAPFAIRLIK